MKTAVIILGHGSRRQGAGNPLADLAKSLRTTGEFELVEYAFLQYAEPFLPEVIERCVAHGAGRIVLVPFFTQPGSHVSTDIPVMVQDARRKHPAVIFQVSEHVGAHRMITDIVADLARKAN
ncbi:MAG: CbiX/SirB N-terminal domain-containing protein [Nitrospiraceae bacterium]|nr:CbiX/SirB N-terminal domain-containing protein [Nitrospiraceae bacterium]